MSDETSTDPQPEAQATPDEKGDDLREILGDEFEEFEAFRESKAAWDSQKNKHNEAAARAAKEAAEARDDLLKALASRNETQTGEPDERLATMQEFAASIGIDLSDPAALDDPLTAKQAYGIYQGMMSWGLGKTSELSKEVTSVKENITDFTERFSQSEEGFANYLASNTIDALEEKYPELDRDEMFSAIREGADLDGDELMGFLDRKARASHERMDSKISEREKKRREKSKDRTYRGAGRATPVAGEKLPADITSPEFMREFLKRNPAPVDGHRDEEIV